MHTITRAVAGATLTTTLLIGSASAAGASAPSQTTTVVDAGASHATEGRNIAFAGGTVRTGKATAVGTTSKPAKPAPKPAPKAKPKPWWR